MTFRALSPTIPVVAPAIRMDEHSGLTATIGQPAQRQTGVMDEHPPALMPASDSQAPTLRIEVLGAFRVAVGAAEIADTAWRLSKARSLVKLLALSPGRRLHREQVIDLLWPDLEPAAAANNLHQALHAARRALATVPGGQELPVLLLQRQVLALDPPIPVWIDADAFDASARAAMASDDPAGCYAAIDLYHGELLPEDRYEEWTIERRDHLREQYVQTLLRLATLHEVREEYTPAIDALRRVIADDPAREEAYTGLMRLYALTGRQPQALRLYQRLVEALAEEFDAEPAPETQRLYRAILDRRFPPVTQQAGARTSPPLPRPPPAPAPAPALGARPLGPFVDRERELALLVAGLGEALAGRGQALLLAGEPGIGKTRLIEELARIARERGAAVLWGRCYDGEGAPAYWPWMQIIRAYAATAPIDALRRELGSAAADIALVVPDLRERLPDVPLAATLDPEQTRFRLFDAVTAFLAAVAARTPLVLVLDDLHWADRSSLLLLEYLADALHGIPMLLVGSYRDVEVDRRHPVTRTLARFSREGTGARIQLTGFGPDDIARFSEVTTGQTSPAGLAEAIYAQTEGNPFFVREVVRLLVEEGRYAPIEQVGSWRISIPRGVREAIVLRLDRLSETTNRVLMVAAVIGREFHLAVLEQVSDLPPSEALAAVEDGLAAGALVESATSPGLFRFSHALIQQTLYEELSRARRVGLHRRIAEAIERVYAANLTPWLDTLAWHYYQAAPDGAPAKAIEYLTLAGTHAMDQVAWAEAAGHFARALELLDSLPAADERRRCELLLALGRVQQHAGDTALARATFLRAAAIARALDAPEQLARAALGAAATEEEVTPADVGSIELLEAAIAALGADDSALRATVLAQLSQALHYHDPSATARRRELSAEAVAIARRLGDEGTLATALLARLDAYWDPLHIDARLADTQEIIAIAERAGNARLALTGHAWRLVDLMELGDMAGVDTEIDAYGRLASDSRLPYSLWSHTNKRVMRTLVRGDFDEAERLAREAFALGARPAPGTADDIYLIHCFAIARERGGLEEIEARIRRLDLTGPVLSRIFPYLLALLYADLGRTVEARVEYERLVGQELERMPVDPHWLFAVALLADVCATLEDSATAGTLDQLLGPFAGRNVSIGSGIVCFGPVSTFLGRLAALLGRWDAAERHFGAAVAMARAMEAPPFVARGLLAWAEALRRRDAPGDQAAARGRLIEAREIATRHDMRLVGTRVAALLSRD